MPRTLTISGNDFAKGLVTAKPSHTIPYGAAESLQNVDFARLKDRIPKRAGIQVEQAELVVGGVTSVCGYHQYIKSSGTKINLVAAGNRVYSVAAGVYTQRHLGTMAGANVNFCTFQNLAFMTGVTESLMVWDGVAGTFTTALGVPPANGQFICVWQNRLWILNTAAGKSRLHYSADGNGQDWLTAGAAGFIDINNDDGDEGTGLLPVGTALYVFKNRTVYRVTGTKPDNFVPQPIILGRGCASPRSIVGMGGFVIYLSQYGLHSLAPDVDGFLSEAVQFDIERLPSKATACAGRVKDTYVLAYDSNADGKNDSAYVLDLRSGAWSKYTNVKANVFFTQDDGVLLSGGSEKIIVRHHDSGEDDEGVAIDMLWRSGRIGFDDFTAMKRGIDVFWNAKPIAGKTLTTRLLVDGVQFDSSSDALDAHQTLSTDENIKIIGKNSTSMYGRFMQVEFRNNELAAPVEITELSMSADLEPRQQTPT
jgi:hypothetical protein